MGSAVKMGLGLGCEGWEPSELSQLTIFTRGVTLVREHYLFAMIHTSEKVLLVHGTEVPGQAHE